MEHEDYRLKQMQLEYYREEEARFEEYRRYFEKVGFYKKMGLRETLNMLEPGSGWGDESSYQA